MFVFVFVCCMASLILVVCLVACLLCFMVVRVWCVGLMCACPIRFSLCVCMCGFVIVFVRVWLVLCMLYVCVLRVLRSFRGSEFIAVGVNVCVVVFVVSMSCVCSVLFECAKFVLCVVVFIVFSCVLVCSC